MEHIVLSEIAKSVGADISEQSGSLVIENITTDSRSITPQSLFVAIKGERFDGHDYVESALSSGSVAAVVQRGYKTNISDATLIFVDDTIDAFMKISGYYRSLFDIPVVAVTGSVGKTTTKDMIAAVLSKKYPALYRRGNLF